MGVCHAPHLHQLKDLGQKWIKLLGALGKFVAFLSDSCKQHVLFRALSYTQQGCSTACSSALHNICRTRAPLWQDAWPGISQLLSSMDFCLQK